MFNLILNLYEGLSSTNMGSQVRSLNPKKTEAETRPERLSSTNMGSGRGTAEAGTGPKGLSSTNMGSQVPGHNPKKTVSA